MPKTIIPIRQINLGVSVQSLPLEIWLNGTKATVEVKTQILRPIPVISRQINVSVGPAPVQFKIQPIDVILPISGLNTAALSMVFGETPSGAIDGINAIYLSAGNYLTNSLSVFLNGIRQRRVADYNETGYQSFSFLSAPLPGDSLSIDYIRS